MDPHHDDTNSNLFQKNQNIATFPDSLSNCMVAPHLWGCNSPSWLQSLFMDPHLDNTNSNVFERTIKTTMMPDLRLRTWQAKQIIQHFTESLINNVKHNRKYPNPVLDYCYCCKRARVISPNLLYQQLRMSARRSYKAERQRRHNLALEIVCFGAESCKDVLMNNGI